ncbi:MAG: hypothetical protein ACI9L9_001837 [Marivirga sp.]|jgi:hypothetical protein
MKKTILILLLSVIVAEAFAQSFYNRRINRRWEVSGSLGNTASLTELTPVGNYFDPKLNFGGDIQYKFGGRFNARVGVDFFQLSGNDLDIPEERNTRARGLSYTSNNIELSGTVAVSLFGHSDRFTDRKFINPYIFAGVGLLYFDPRAEIPDSLIRNGVNYGAVPNAGKRVSLARYNTERADYSRFALVIPMGIGLRVKVTSFMDISGEVSGRITFTDYLDDISSTSYPELDQFDWQNNEDELIAAALSSPLGSTGRRGNPDSNDYYMLFKVKANFYIQGDLLNKVFGIGGKKFNVKPSKRRRRGGGIFSKKGR